jgi:adenine specific DNA methylase Mod
MTSLILLSAYLLIFDNNEKINLNILIDDIFVTSGILDEKIIFSSNGIAIDSISIRFIPGEIVLDSIQRKKLYS